MQHTSVQLNTPCEFINVTPLNPLISKCQIKVCYVGDTPNRNRSIITKEVATKMANSLPGSPIVGYYKEEVGDFDQHSKTLEIRDGKLNFKSITKPYGFVDLNAKCWFQKFLDDGVIEREYLMTEGYLWTGQFPECARIIEHGNNQSMELDQKTINAYWTKTDSGKPQFFIINEALISKLCILGENQEPCFEGASITKFEFSFDDSFKNELSSMIGQLQNFIDEGGKMMQNEEVKIPTDFAKEDEENKKKKQEAEDKAEKENEAKTEDKSEEQKPSGSEEKKEDDEDEKKKKKPTEFAKEEVCADCGKPMDECKCNTKAEYCLDEITEYVQLKADYEQLQNEYSALLSEKEAADATIESLNQFKLQAERKDKEAMIETFYMLSDEDKKDVVENIDTYSLDDIEAKLSIICVRNKVNFNLEEETKEETKDPISYNLNSGELEDENTPAWVRAARAIQNKNN